MARGVYSTTNHFVYAGGVVTATPLTMSCWCYLTTTPTGGKLVGLFYTSGAGTKLDGFDIAVVGTTGNIIADTGDGTTVNNATSAAGANLTAWNHIGGVFTSAASRNAWLNGVKSSTSTVSRTPSAAANKTAIGVKYNQNNSKDGGALEMYIAEVAIWSVALTDAEMAQLATGCTPLLVCPESLVSYYPLIRGDTNGDEPDLMGGLKMVEQGTVPVAAHPRVFYPNRPRVLRLSAAVTSITGTLNVTLDGISLSAAGNEPIAGVLAKTLDGITLASAGNLPVTGAATITLAGVSISAAGSLPIAGAFTKTLDGIGLTATGNEPIAGVANVTLSGIGLSATGTVADVGTVTGALNVTLAGLSLAASGKITVAGVLTQTLAGVGLTATGNEPIAGAANVTLAGVSILATGTVATAGVVTALIELILAGRSFGFTLDSRDFELDLQTREYELDLKERE
jgi:hypothetical protein